MHWATQYIGKPWELAATGPESYDCWGLVRHIQLNRFGIEMPLLTVGDMARVIRSAEQWKSLRELLSHTPWKRVDDCKEGDVALMRSTAGPHVGVVVESDGVYGILHAMGSVGKAGGVIYTRPNEMIELGFARLEYWRYTDEF